MMADLEKTPHRHQHGVSAMSPSATNRKNHHTAPQEWNATMQHLNHEAPKNNRRLLYVCLPRKLATQPPLRQLTPFQLDIACALIAAARGVLADDLHVRALKGGKAAIQTEMKTSTEYFKTRWWADQGRSYPVPPKGVAIKRAGEKGYRSRKKAIRRRPPPDVIPLEVSRSGLLRWAKLAPHGRGTQAPERCPRPPDPTRQQSVARNPESMDATAIRSVALSGQWALDCNGVLCAGAVAVTTRRQCQGSVFVSAGNPHDRNQQGRY